MTKRRKFLLGMGSLAAGGAATIGSGAFDQVWANRDIAVKTVGDANAYLGIEDKSVYANTSGKELYLDFNGGPDQNGKGLNENANSRFHNVFWVRNNGTKPVTVFANTLGSDGNLNGWASSDMALYWSEDEVAEKGGFNYDGVFHPSGNVEDEDLGGYAENGFKSVYLHPGKAIAIHVMFFLQGDEGTGDIPDEFALYASSSEYGDVTVE